MQRMTPRNSRAARSSVVDNSAYAGLLKPGRKKKPLRKPPMKGGKAAALTPKGMGSAVGGGTASREVAKVKPGVRKPSVMKPKPAASAPMPLPAPTPRPNPGAKLMPGEMMQPRAGRVGPVMRPRPVPKKRGM